MPWTPATLAGMLGLWSVGVAVICGVDLARATSSTNLTPFFYSTRYATPLHYPNATAALAAIAIWPALVLSARREVPAWARIPLLAVAVFLADFAFLPQSRGALVGIVITAVVVVLIAGRRIALLVRMLVAGGAMAVTIPRTVAVYQALTDGRLVRPQLDHTASGMLVTTAAALAVSAVLVAIEHWVIPRRVADWRPPRPGRRGAVAIAVVAVLAVAGGVVVAGPPVSHLVRTVWRSGKTDASTGSVRLLSATPEERFDYVRAAVKLFEDSPVVGIGSGNFGRRYDAVRHFPKHSQYTHNLVLRVLSETGIVGTLLFLLTVLALIVGLLKAVRERPGLGRGCAVAAAGVACYFLVHSSFEWIDEFPVLAAPPVALALAAIELRRDAPRRAAAPLVTTVAPESSAGSAGGLIPRWRRLTRRRPPAIVATAMLVAGAIAIAVALGSPYLASRYTSRGLAISGTNPTGAYADFNRAASIDPLSASALLSEGTVALDLNDPGESRRAFDRALGREDTWYPHLELALLDAQAAQFAPALVEITDAARLDHDDPLVQEAQELIKGRHRIDPISFNKGFVEGAQSDIFTQQTIR